MSVRTHLTLCALIVTVGVSMAIFSTMMATIPIPIARAKGQGPPGVHIGNPHDFSTGPPIPNCNAVDQGNFHGPPDDPRKGCKVIP